MITLIPNTPKLLTSSKVAQKPHSRAVDLASDVAQKSRAPQFGMASDDESGVKKTRLRRPDAELKQLKTIAAQFFSSEPSNVDLANKVNAHCKSKGIALSHDMSTTDAQNWRQQAKSSSKNQSHSSQVPSAAPVFPPTRPFPTQPLSNPLVGHFQTSLLNNSFQNSSSFVDLTDNQSVSSYHSNESVTRYPEMSRKFKNLLKRFARKPESETLAQQASTLRKQETLAWAKTQLPPNAVLGGTDVAPEFLEYANSLIPVFTEKTNSFIKKRLQQASQSKVLTREPAFRVPDQSTALPGIGSSLRDSNALPSLNAPEQDINWLAANNLAFIPPNRPTTPSIIESINKNSRALPLLNSPGLDLTWIVRNMRRCYELDQKHSRRGNNTITAFEGQELEGIKQALTKFESSLASQFINPDFHPAEHKAKVKEIKAELGEGIYGFVEKYYKSQKAQPASSLQTRQTRPATSSNSNRSLNRQTLMGSVPSMLAHPNRFTSTTNSGGTEGYQTYGLSTDKLPAMNSGWTSTQSMDSNMLPAPVRLPIETPLDSNTFGSTPNMQTYPKMYAPKPNSTGMGGYQQHGQIPNTSTDYLFDGTGMPTHKSTIPELVDFSFADASKAQFVMFMQEKHARGISPIGRKDIENAITETIPPSAHLVSDIDGQGNARFRYPDRPYGNEVAKSATLKRFNRTGDYRTQITMVNNPTQPGRAMYIKTPITDLSPYFSDTAQAPLSTKAKQNLLLPPPQTWTGFEQQSFSGRNASNDPSASNPGLTQGGGYQQKNIPERTATGRSDQTFATPVAPNRNFGPANLPTTNSMTDLSQFSLTQVQKPSSGQVKSFSQDPLRGFQQSSYPDPWNSEQASLGLLNPESKQKWMTPSNESKFDSRDFEEIFETPDHSTRQSTDAPSTTAFSYNQPDIKALSTTSLKRPRSSAGSSVNTADSTFLKEEVNKNTSDTENIRDIYKKVTHWRRKKKVQDSVSERRSPSPESFDEGDIGYLQQLGSDAERQKDFRQGKSYKRVARRIGNILKRS